MINDEILDIISDAVSDYADRHWGRDDFDNEYERGKYLRELAEGNGWNDDVADEVLGMIEGEEWEDEDGVVRPIDVEDQEVVDAVYEAIESEASYWAD
jgi:hypothetical protein